MSKRFIQLSPVAPCSPEGLEPGDNGKIHPLYLNSETSEVHVVCPAHEFNEQVTLPKPNGSSLQKQLGEFCVGCALNPIRPEHSARELSH